MKENKFIIPGINNHCGLWTTIFIAHTLNSDKVLEKFGLDNLNDEQLDNKLTNALGSLILNSIKKDNSKDDLIKKFEKFKQDNKLDYNSLIANDIIEKLLDISNDVLEGHQTFNELINHDALLKKKHYEPNDMYHENLLKRFPKFAKMSKMNYKYNQDINNQNDIYKSSEEQNILKKVQELENELYENVKTDLKNINNNLDVKDDLYRANFTPSEDVEAMNNLDVKDDLYRANFTPSENAPISKEQNGHNDILPKEGISNDSKHNGTKTPTLKQPETLKDKGINNINSQPNVSKTDESELPKWVQELPKWVQKVYKFISDLFTCSCFKKEVNKTPVPTEKDPEKEISPQINNKTLSKDDEKNINSEGIKKDSYGNNLGYDNLKKNPQEKPRRSSYTTAINKEKVSSINRKNSM